MIGVSRQTINKELKGLERAGMQLAYGRIVARDAQQLRTAGEA
jgi:hypothetical protein